MQLVLETLARARQLPRRLRSKALRFGAIAVAVGAACIAAPVLAHDGPKTPPPACGTTLPLTTPCTPTVVRPGEPGAPYLVTLPGVGTLSFIIDPATNKIISATVSGLGVNFTASTPKISADGTKVSVTFTNSADPTQVYRVKVRVKPPETAGGAPVVKASVRGAAHWHSEHKQHHGEHEGGR
jgi:hypothetical protein